MGSKCGPNVFPQYFHQLWLSLLNLRLVEILSFEQESACFVVDAAPSRVKSENSQLDQVDDADSVSARSGSRRRVSSDNHN